MSTKKQETGTRKYIESPEQLWAWFQDYLNDIESDPYKEQQWVGKDGREVHKRIRKFPNLLGFEGYLAKHDKLKYIGDYFCNKDNRYGAYADTVARIKATCAGEMVTAAVSGVANSPLVAAIHKISSKTEVEHSGSVEQITGVRIIDSEI